MLGKMEKIDLVRSVSDDVLGANLVDARVGAPFRLASEWSQLQ